ncbi:MAG: hypothetical protein LBC73_07450, partial [Oscillospiraceae bacterium]|nr:hypothetical protein [Oscillospiraceae bacterium]
MKEQNATKRTIEIVSKTKTFYTFILVLMIILLALTVSCKNAVDDTFNGNNKDPNDDDNGVIISPTPTIPPEDDFDVLLPERDSFDGETLYIAVYSEFLYRNILREYQSVNPGVKIEILSLED